MKQFLLKADLITIIPGIILESEYFDKADSPKDVQEITLFDC